jgi:hypothetical protein
MSSLKQISDMLIKIAYSDKNDRPSMIKELEVEFDSLPSSETSIEQQKLIASILNELEKESLSYVEIDGLDKNKASKTRAKKLKEVEISKPNIEEIKVVEPEIVTVEKEPEIINQELIIEKPKVERKTKVKLEPKEEEHELSFLDDIDNLF